MQLCEIFDPDPNWGTFQDLNPNTAMYLDPQHGMQKLIFLNFPPLQLAHLIFRHAIHVRQAARTSLLGSTSPS